MNIGDYLSAAKQLGIEETHALCNMLNHGLPANELRFVYGQRGDEIAAVFSDRGIINDSGEINHAHEIVQMFSVDSPSHASLITPEGGSIPNDLNQLSNSGITTNGAKEGVDRDFPEPNTEAFEIITSVVVGNNVAEKENRAKEKVGGYSVGQFDGMIVARQRLEERLSREMEQADQQVLRTTKMKSRRTLKVSDVRSALGNPGIDNLNVICHLYHLLFDESYRGTVFSLDYLERKGMEPTKSPYRPAMKNLAERFYAMTRTNPYFEIAQRMFELLNLINSDGFELRQSKGPMFYLIGIVDRYERRLSEQHIMTMQTASLRMHQTPV